MKMVETLRELQLISIEIYRDLKNFCDQHGLKVYLHGGTLIGAIRHKGYIPWDDDIDVCMSRPDYRKMMEISDGIISERCTAIDPETNDEFNGYIPVVVYNNSKIQSGQYRTKENLKISISIFVFDGITNNTLFQKLYYLHMFILRAEHALCRADFRHVNTKLAKIVGPIMQPFYDEHNVNKYKNLILRFQQKYAYEFCEYVSTNADYQSSREVCKKSDFEKAVPVIFEGIESLAYSHYDAHLRAYYGDYMELPPEQERNAKHSFEAWVEESFDYERDEAGL